MGLMGKPDWLGFWPYISLGITAAWILTVWLVTGKAVEDSQDARQEVLLPANTK
ncbi:MAG: hypothetical protein NVS9B15_14760 [Acidobacteriaceae bacterium]